MYTALESVQCFFNTQLLRVFNSETAHAKDMIKRMKSLGLDIN